MDEVVLDILRSMRLSRDITNIEKGVKMDLGVPELLIVLVIIILLFGPGRIAKTMGELGEGIKSLREGISSKPKEEVKSNPPSNRS